MDRGVGGVLRCEQLREEIRLVRGTIVDILARMDDITLQRLPQIRADYALKIGCWEQALLEAELAVRRARRRLALAQAQANRGETSHVEGIEGLAQSLSEGDRLRLERDPHNSHDCWAIRVLDARGRRLGFVPADINEIPARLMDGGKRLYGEVAEVRLVGSWWRIGMGVWMDD